MASLEVLPHRHEFHLAVQEATPTKTILKNITLLLISITLTRLTSTEMANYPGTKLVGVALKVRKLNEKFAVVLSCSQKNPLEFGHFTLMFCTGRQRNVPKFKTRAKLLLLLIKPFVFSLLSSQIRRRLPDLAGPRLH